MSGLASQCSILARQLSAFAVILEEGQADSPLRQYGHDVEALAENPVRHLNIIAFGSGSLETFFHELLGVRPESLMKKIETIAGSCVIDLVADGYFLNSGQRRISFPNAESLLDAINAQSATPLVIGLPKPGGLAPIRFNLLDKQALLMLDISAANTLANHGPALLVLAPDQYALNPEDRGAYVQAVSNATFLWPVVLPPLSGQSAAPNWLQEPIPGHLKIIPAWRVSRERALPALLRQDSCAEADALQTRFCIQCVRRYAGLLEENMKSVSDSAAFQLQANEVLLEIANDTSDHDSAIQKQRKAVAVFRDEVNALLKSFQTRSRHNLAGQHVYPQLVDHILDDLQEGDLVRSQEHKSFRLGLSENAISKIKSGVWQTLVQRHRDETNEFLEAVGKEMISTGIADKSFSRSLAHRKQNDADQLSDIDSLKTLLDFKARYRGEMQKRGFLKRLGEGRRAVFMVLMIFSIFGSMVGFNYRKYAIFGVMFLVIFIGSSIYTFFSWKKDDKHLLRREVEKARDQIRMDVLRSITDLERERLNRLGDWFQDCFQDLQRDFEDWRIASQKDEQSRVEQARRLSKSRDEKLQRTIRELDKYRQEIARIRENLEEIKQQHLTEVKAIGFS